MCREIHFLRRRELPSNSFLIVRRGEHCHDNPGISSGRLWMPHHDFMARKYHADTKKSSVDGLLAFFEMQRISGPVPDRNRISNWLRHLPKVRPDQELALSQHVEPSKRPIEEWCK